MDSTCGLPICLWGDESKHKLSFEGWLCLELPHSLRFRLLIVHNPNYLFAKHSSSPSIVLMAPRRQALRAQKRISYQEDGSTSDISDEGTEGSTDEISDCDSFPKLHRRKVSHRTTRYAPRKRRPSRSIKEEGPKTKKPRPQMQSITSSDIEEIAAPPDLICKLVSWQSLPYEILADIFLYASQPLWTSEFRVTHSAHWLLETATICRSFAEPAISALYFSPPLSPPSRARNLIESLATQTNGSMFNYANKIKYLDVEADMTLGRKYRGQDPIDLGNLIRLTPQLRGVRIHLSPTVVFRLASRIRHKTSYQESIFTALKIKRIALQDWIWCSDLAGKRYQGPKLEAIHHSHAFQSLRNLTFIRYDEVHAAEEELAVAIKSLPSLKNLVFKGSRIINEKLMPVLPTQLERLELVNCPNLDSEGLSIFLETGGQNLLELILNHNQALNLSFLTDFAISCPKVQKLKMDLLYHSPNLTFIDVEARFDSLINSDETPTWPSSLQDIELLYLRKWDLGIAECFFSSLVDSAASLPDLRRIKIRASVEESGWRERVEFRDKWTSRLRDVFLRVSKPPGANFRSITAFKAYKQRFPHGIPQHQQVIQKLGHIEVKKPTLKEHVPVYHDSDSETEKKPTAARRSRRLLAIGARILRETSTGDDSVNDGDEDDGYKSPKPSRSIAARRTRQHRKKDPDASSSSEDSALDDDPATENPSEEDDTDTPKQKSADTIFIQGMCNVVNVFIDNLRPTEEQLHESDFLDEEMSGDEDWNGDADVAGDDHYAW